MATARKIQTKSGYKIGLYIRASTEEQGSQKNPEGTIKNQELRLKNAIEGRNINANFGEVVEIFIDDGISAKNTKRPQLQRMLKAIENKEINMVMVTEYSRLSRNMRDFAGMWELFKDFGCGLVSLREQFDTSSAAGEMMLYNMANLAQFERRLTSERVTSSRHDRASRGLFNGGVIPLGYRKVQGKSGYLEIDEEEALTIRELFRAFLREGSISKAAKWLNDNGYTPSRMIHGGGNKARVGHFTVGNSRCILTNKFYIGILEYKKDGETLEAKAVWPAIIDDITFDQTQKLIKENFRKKKPASKTRYPYTLSGLVHCAVCGDVMCGKSAHGRNGKVGYYEHSWSMRKNSTLTEKALDCGMYKRVPAKKLEPLIDELVLKLLTKNDLAQNMIFEARKVYQKNYSVKAQLQEVKKEISSYKAQSEALIERIAKLPIEVPADSFYEMLTKLKKRSEKANKELSMLKNQEGIGADVPSELKEYVDYVQTLKRIWQSTDRRDSDFKNKLIKKLVARIEISKKGVIIYYHVGRNQIKKESFEDSFFKPVSEPIEFLENSKKISKNVGSRTCNNGAVGGT